MNHIRHIAISAQEPENTAEFYKEAFGFKEVGRISKEQGVLAHGVFLSDGLLNLAILKFKSEQGGISPDKVGLHHFGILVDNLDEVSAKIESLGGACFLKRPEDGSKGFFETKFVGPDGVVFDISEHPWKNSISNS